MVKKNTLKNTTSSPHSSSTEFQALFLTFRRGGAVYLSAKLQPQEIVKNEKVIKSAQLSLEIGAEPSQNFLVWGSLGQGFSVAVSHSTTAEQLSNMYNSCLNSMQISDSQVQTLAVGVGPGSFTGLRLGCAFANGLSILHNRRLVALPCPTSGQLGTDFSQFVTFDDIVEALHLFMQGAGHEVSTFVPQYGAEPGPVIKLREAEALLASAPLSSAKFRRPL